MQPLPGRITVRSLKFTLQPLNSVLKHYIRKSPPSYTLSAGFGPAGNQIYDTLDIPLMPNQDQTLQLIYQAFSTYYTQYRSLTLMTKQAQHRSSQRDFKKLGKMQLRQLHSIFFQNLTSVMQFIMNVCVV